MPLRCHAPRFSCHDDFLCCCYCFRFAILLIAYAVAIFATPAALRYGAIRYATIADATADYAVTVSLSAMFLRAPPLCLRF